MVRCAKTITTMMTVLMPVMVRCLRLPPLRTSPRTMKMPYRTITVNNDKHLGARSSESVMTLSRSRLQSTATEGAMDVTKNANKKGIQHRNGRRVPNSRTKGVFQKNKKWNNNSNSSKKKGSSAKKSSKRGSKKQASKGPPPVRQTVGDNGRQIMTHDKMKNIMEAGSTLNTNNALNVLNTLKQGDKLRFTQHSSHKQAGGRTQHDGTFIATMKTTLPPGELPIIPQDGRVLDDGNIELCNTGEARTKKEAQRLSALDFLLQLTECRLDPLNLSTRKEKEMTLRKKEERRFKEEVLPRAQMLLELFADGWPRFRTSEAPKTKKGPGQFVTEINMRMAHSINNVNDGWRGNLLNAVGPPAKSKAESQGRALVEAAGEPLERVVGRNHVEAMKNIIEMAPGKHIAALKVAPLPSNAFATLSYAIGSMEEHFERMTQLEKRQATFEERFNQRMESSWRGKENDKNREQRQIRMSDRDLDENRRLQNLMENEENVRLEKALSDPEGSQGVMKSVRDALPIKAIKDGLLEALQAEQVVVVSGGTGSGKSTQCPQYILEDAIARGQGCETRIVVTQPRRIAAISVAERMAAERDESLGNSVGYSVRLNSVQPREKGSVEFVTTGILLRRLMHDRTIEGVSHVIIDEVHERDINTDFLLVLLRELIEIRPDLRVVLMSATLDASSFKDYFMGGGGKNARQVPLMSVPTKPRHPVKIINLEDIAGEVNERRDTDSSPTEVFSSDLQTLAHSLLRAHDEQLQLDLEEAEAEEQAADELEKLSAAEDEGEILAGEEDARVNLGPSSRLKSLRQAVEMRGTPHGFASTLNGRKKTPDRDVNIMGVSLIAKMAQHVAEIETNAGRKGSILCFLPGWDEIKAAMSVLEEECHPNLYNKMTILPLHSTIPKEEQHRIFEPAEDGKVKVIFATNIAESSVTINDVLAIVDSGLVREMNWDAESAMSTMETVPTSRASVTQRTGRAGRVAPGTCYRLFSRGAMKAMNERPMPEIKRTGLENTCLQTCTMTRDGVQDFLARAMDPPARETIAVALDRLEKLGAVKADSEKGCEKLTPLGRLLSRLPLDPSTGRMLIVGCVMKCLDPVLTAAALFSSRDPFYTPPGMRDEARKIRQSFCDDSDLMASIRAFNTFEEITRTEGWFAAREWAAENFVSTATMKTISSVKSQLLNELQRIGLVQNRDLLNLGRRNKKVLREDAPLNQHADNEALYKAVCATGLPDNLAARRQLGHFGTLRTRMENHAGLHPSSVAFHRKPPQERDIELPNWFLYNEMVLSSQVFIRHCTALTPEQILLFGGNSLERLPNSSPSAAQEVEALSFLGQGKVNEENDKEENVEDLNKELDDIFDTILNKAGGPKLMVEENTSATEETVDEKLDGMFHSIFDEWEGKSEVVSSSYGHMVLDEWIVVDSKCEKSVDLLAAVRREIDAALAYKVMSSRNRLPEASEEVIDAIAEAFDILDDNDSVESF